MKKSLKGCLLFLIIILIIIGWFYYGMITSKDRENAAILKCEKTEFISERPLIILEKNSNRVIDSIHVYLERNSKIIKDTLLKENIVSKTKYFSFNIPFKKFKKTDIIIVETKNEKYKISGFSYSLKGRWVMFGYSGGDCSLDYHGLKINEKEYNGITLQEEEYERNKIVFPEK